MLKGLASDGGLYIPEDVPKADDWQSWKDLSFNDLAYRVMSLYISPSEIPPQDLKDIIAKSYSTFRSTETTPLVHLKDNLHLLELFHGPTFAFKDVALQFLGNLFEYFLVRKNEGKTGKGMSCYTCDGNSCVTLSRVIRHSAQVAPLLLLFLFGLLRENVVCAARIDFHST